MKARVENGQVMVGLDGMALYEQSGFGRPLKEGVRLSPVEALYLVYRGRIEIPSFEFDSLMVYFSSNPHVTRSFMVYRDLRERGYVVQTGPHDFRVFRREEKNQEKENPCIWFGSYSERDLIDFAVVRHEVQATSNMRKLHVLAVVDDEFELTYYEVKIQKLTSLDASTTPGSSSGILTGRSVFIRAPPESGYDQAFYGKRFDDERIILSNIESLALMEGGLVTVDQNGRSIPESEYRSLLHESDSEMEQKLLVYKHLRSLNYIPKTGYKFGHHFRVYLGRKVHSDMLVQAIAPQVTLPMNSISRSVRMAHSVKKKMLFGCIHAEGIAYVEFARIKL